MEQLHKNMEFLQHHFKKLYLFGRKMWDIAKNHRAEQSQLALYQKKKIFHERAQDIYILDIATIYVLAAALGQILIITEAFRTKRN